MVQPPRRPAGPPYRPSDVRQRRDMIKNFLAVPELLDSCAEKLSKVMITEGQQGFATDDARRFVLEFLFKAIFDDRDEEVKANRQVKTRPKGVPDADREENFWKQQIEEAIKDTGLKSNKNSRDQLKNYL